jgi:hypothetical protein
MNPFDPKVALLEKHVQHPVIDPHTYGSEHRPNVWLTNSNLPHLACVARGDITVLPASCYFLITVRNISRGLTV